MVDKYSRESYKTECQISQRSSFHRGNPEKPMEIVGGTVYDLNKKFQLIDNKMNLLPNEVGISKEEIKSN